MSLQRCTKSHHSFLASLLSAMLLAGCAGNAPSTSSIDRAGEQPGATSSERETSRAASGPVDVQEAAEATVIPPAVLTMFEQAAVAMASGDTVDAELRFKEFLLSYPQYPGAHVNLAIIQANNNDPVAARASIDAALALNANHAPALNQLGLLLRKNGKFLEAEAAYLKAVTVKSDYALAHYNLGVLNELYLQRLDVALRHFEIYQSLVGEDKQVARWISDLERRVSASQGSANATE